MIISLDRIKKYPQSTSWHDRNVVLTHGCWDVMHPGHLEHLKQANKLADILVVGVTGDAYVNKGPGRPVFNENERATILNSFREVDYVVIVNSSSAIPLIEAVKPDYYVKGPDYQEGIDSAGNLERERLAVETYGGKLVFTEGTKYSSTEIIERLAQVHDGCPSVPAQIYLEQVKRTVQLDQVLEWIDAAKDLTVQLIGEPILDQYVYVTPGGKSAKENTITYVGAEMQSFRGGIDAIAAHLFKYVNDTEVVQSLNAIVKTRYVQREFMNKVFSHVPYSKVLVKLDTVALQPQGDFTLVADFGHGLIPDTYIARSIIRKAKWMALTVQANSLNWGFNLLTKYPSAHYVVADEMEVRLASCDNVSHIRTLVEYHTARMGCQMFAATRGHDGCIIYDGSDYEEVPALATKVVDRMGAGDAFLAWTAPLVYLGAPKEVIGLVGSVASAIKVEHIGNEPVTKEQVVKRLGELLA